MTPFRWKNCYAEVAAAEHDLTIRSFLDDVLVAALSDLWRTLCRPDNVLRPLRNRS
jgi:hypothetical protein